MVKPLGNKDSPRAHAAGAISGPNTIFLILIPVKIRISATNDSYVPFRFHAAKVSSAIGTQATFRIKHTRDTVLAHKHHPMPEWNAPLQMPLEREQSDIGQRIPRLEWALARVRVHATVT